MWGDDRSSRRREGLFVLAQALGAASDERAAADVIKRHVQDDCFADEVALILAGPERGQAVVRDLTGGLDTLASGAISPASCLAIRLGRPHEKRLAAPHPLRCEVCAQVRSDVATVPLVAAGTVLGALVAAGPRLHPRTLVRLDDVAAVAGPVVAALRSFALASAHAHTDALTGLPNRRAGEERIDQLVALSRRTAQPLALLRIDVDRMLELSDDVGRESGDLAIASLAALLRARLRSSDMVARVGGDEFLVALPGTAGEEAVVLAESLCALVGELTPPEASAKLTVSVGISAFPVDAESPLDLLASAERALVSAKADGGNRVTAVEPPDPWTLLNDLP
jgi:diguanylate cyclase (GGDEF)-like protein